jgi:hypothetical protein
MCIWINQPGFYYTLDGLYAIRREKDNYWYIYRRGYSFRNNVHLGSFRLLKDAKRYIQDLYKRGV